MCLATAAAAQAWGGILSQDVLDQLQYADMLNVSRNWNSPYCQVIQEVDENVSQLGFPFMQYYTEANYNSALEWLYPGVSRIAVLIFCALLMRV